jgi:hypothetical protein
MIDMFAGLGIVLLLAALYAVRRRARQLRRRKLHRRTRTPLGRTISARTEMRACSSPTSTLGMLQKRSRRSAAGG